MEEILIISIVLVLLPLGIVVYTNVRVSLAAVILMLPFYHSALMPRQMFGISGFNPFNIALLGLMVAIFYGVLSGRYKLEMPKFSPLLSFYILPIILSAMYGATQIDGISSYFVHSRFRLTEERAIELLSLNGYLSSILVKPLILVMMSYVVAVCVATFKISNLARIILYVAAAIVPIALVVGLSVQGLGLVDISTAQDRGSLSWFGMHANELGLMLNIAFALSLFGLFHTPPSPLTLKLGSILLFLLSFGVFLTFSRGAMVAYFFVIMAFILRKGVKPSQLIIVPMILIGLALLPGEVFERLFTGLDSRDIEAISAGRVDNIWLPLLPVVFENFIFGGGLGSIMWSTPMQMGAILPVGHAHSAYLGLLLDFGIVGSGMILYFWWKVWWLFDQAASKKNEFSGFFIGAKVGMVTLFLQGLTDDKFTPTASQVFIWVSIGLAIGLRHINYQGQFRNI